MHEWSSVPLAKVKIDSLYKYIYRLIRKCLNQERTFEVVKNLNVFNNICVLE